MFLLISSVRMRLVISLFLCFWLITASQPVGKLVNLLIRDIDYNAVWHLFRCANRSIDQVKVL